VIQSGCHNVVLAVDVVNGGQGLDPARSTGARQDDGLQHLASRVHCFDHVDW